MADRLGVSIATVSRAMNDKPGVSPETRERVLALAQELQYQPNLAARSLVTSRTNTVLFVVHHRPDERPEARAGVGDADGPVQLGVVAQDEVVARVAVD